MNYRVLATNLLSTNNYAFDLSAISLMQDEVVTDVRLEFGKVPAGFASVVKLPLPSRPAPTLPMAIRWSTGPTRVANI